MREDGQLLGEYAREGSEPAFSELVRRHIDLVYGTAWRMVGGDAHLAKDVAQCVFIDLAKKAGELRRYVVLAGWLYRHTTFTASKMVRSEQRRRNRERIASEMSALHEKNVEEAWEQIAPRLDECLNALKADDRDALVLRFLKHEDLRMVGAALGISEDAAQKRVSRALEKLRGILSAKGIGISAAALAAAMESQTAAAAPALLAASVTAASLAAGGEKVAAMTLWKLFGVMNVKTGIIGSVVVASLVAPLMFQRQVDARARVQDEALRLQKVELQSLRKENEELLARAGAAQQLSNATNADAELLRLRGEVSKLRSETRQAIDPTRKAPSSREEVLAAMEQLYGGEVAKLKQWLDANPTQRVPEMEFLSENKWRQMVKRPIGETSDALELAASRARYEAEVEFAEGILKPGLQSYADANGGEFPKDLASLKPYFRTPGDDAVLKRWQILPGKDFQLVEDEDWVATTKAPVNRNLDQRIFVGLRAHAQTIDWVAMRK